MRSLTALAIVLGVLVAACSPPAPAPPAKPDLASEEKAITNVLKARDSLHMSQVFRTRL